MPGRAGGSQVQILPRCPAWFGRKAIGMTTSTAPEVRLLASPGTWIDDEAVRQLYACARLAGMRQITGLPALHPGKGYPTGAAFVTEDVIYPTLIGADIGCGLALFKTDLARRRIDLDRWAEVRFELEHPWHEDVGEVIAASELESTAFDEGLGTLGGGGHFVELQALEQVHDRMAAAQLGLDRSELLLLVHSGSHRVGQAIFEDHVEQHGARGLAADSDAATRYLLEHDRAVRWAQVSRGLLARRFLGDLQASGECLLDAAHNRLGCRQDASGTLWIHRRGAVAAEGPVVIAGTRGTFTYLVKPHQATLEHAWSLVPGAGRKWSRTESRARMRERFHRAELEETGLGSRVLCSDRDLLYEEAPGAYKNIETIIADLAAAGLLSVIASLRPVLTYKTRRSHRCW